MTPRHKAPYLIEGTLWVDATDGSIVQLQGTTSKSSSFLTGPTQVMRQYASVNGFSEPPTPAQSQTVPSLAGPS